MKKQKILNENGTVLLSVMGFVIVLFIAGVAANENVNMDIANSVNSLSYTQSLYVAEAGLERARGELIKRYTAGNWNNFNIIFKGTDNTEGTSDDGIPSFGNSVAFKGGTYTVKVLNDVKDPGGQYNDTNNTVSIESVGEYRGAVTKLRTIMRMNKVPYLEGSLTLLGEADTLFNGTSFSIDGRDYRLSDSDTPTGTSNKYAIAVPDGSNRIGVMNTLSSAQSLNVKGLGYDPSASPVIPSVGVSNSVTQEDIKMFIDTVKNIADSNLVNPASLDGVNLGTVSNPRITYVSMTDNSAIKINGNTSGSGILVVEGASLEITINANVSWIGIIVVTGINVGLKQTGSGQIRGGIFVLEKNNPDVGNEMEAGGNFSIKFSSEAIELANSAMLSKKKYSIISWQKVS